MQSYIVKSNKKSVCNHFWIENYTIFFNCIHTFYYLVFVFLLYSKQTAFYRIEVLILYYIIVYMIVCALYHHIWSPTIMQLYVKQVEQKLKSIDYFHLLVLICHLFSIEKSTIKMNWQTASFFFFFQIILFLCIHNNNTFEYGIRKDIFY